MCNPPVICLADWLHSVCYGPLAPSAESSCRQVNDGNHFHQRRIRPSIAPPVFLLFGCVFFIVKPDFSGVWLGFSTPLHLALSRGNPFRSEVESPNLISTLASLWSPPRVLQMTRLLVLRNGGGRLLSPLARPAVSLQTDN